jgi:2-polyprenyl-3-methyl-5-hydroxy-6-metoxy-1,4-benzoquinol methylase
VTFGTPGGGWTVWSCNHCRAHYCDPRPRAEAIHRAYERYYTHQDNGTPGRGKRNKSGGIYRRALSGYLHQRYGSTQHPAWPIGASALQALPALRRRYDREYRNLPACPEQGTLLDIGCGNGTFLELARGCGWRVVGVEPDALAVQQAKARGLDVLHGSLDQLDGHQEVFDQITLSHVIEHLHDPRQVLTRCLELLKPGGRLWIETPNGLSIGHQTFGAAWRGLETPRHLILFTWGNLTQALQDLGFTRVRRVPRHSALRPLFKESLALAEGRPMASRRKLTLQEHLRLMWLEAREALDQENTEVLTVEAYRPTMEC